MLHTGNSPCCTDQVHQQQDQHPPLKLMHLHTFCIMPAVPGNCFGPDISHLQPEPQVLPAGSLLCHPAGRARLWLQHPDHRVRRSASCSARRPALHLLHARNQPSLCLCTPAATGGPPCVPASLLCGQLLVTHVSDAQAPPAAGEPRRSCCSSGLCCVLRSAAALPIVKTSVNSTAIMSPTL